MPQTHSVTEQPEKDIVSVKAIRAQNRSESRRAAAVATVVDRLQVYGVLASTHEIHSSVSRQHAERIVDAVVGLMKPEVGE